MPPKRRRSALNSAAVVQSIENAEETSVLAPVVRGQVEDNDPSGENDKDVPTLDAEAEGEAEPEADTDEDAEEDGTVGNTNGQPRSSPATTNTDLQKTLRVITETLVNHKTSTKYGEEYFPSTLFRRLPNKRILPDYYDVIAEPSALSTLRGKIQRKLYGTGSKLEDVNKDDARAEDGRADKDVERETNRAAVREFVRDFALIVHNAQVYNRPNSQPVRDVLELERVFRREVEVLVRDGFAQEEDLVWPDLGEIPHATPEAEPESGSESGSEEGEEDEEDEDVEEEDEEGTTKRGRKGRRRGGRGRKGAGAGGLAAGEEDVAEAAEKRRGRPPKIATPTEQRIDKILKSLKKLRDRTGAAMIGPFERLPDKTEMPEYYAVIKEPVDYGTLKRKAKRKKYKTVEECMGDIEIMFKNAMHFNEDGSDIHTWASELLKEARRVEAEEKARPDAEYLVAAEGRIPVDRIEYKGQIWKVGDWVHLRNENDVTKPIVAQIYRTWKNDNGEQWINACWYYRPEQTVHQFEKHFFPNEVVKTGQYRDHQIDDVESRCFVMFYTRYHKGRPRNLPEDVEVYVCEARYNEDKQKFNKIKTWASCLPDEVRDKDYEMDLFDQPRKVKKVPSPLLHLLDDTMTENSALPQPQWKSPNAPPIVGGVHRHARDENQSPPPEPTPPPAPLSQITRPPPIPQPSNTQRPYLDHQQSSTYLQSQTQNFRHNQNMTPHSSVPHAINNQYQTQPSTAQAYSGINAQQAYNMSQQPSQAASLPQASTYNTTANTANNHARPMTGTSIQNNPLAYSAMTNAASTTAALAATHRTAEAYVLSDTANAQIPKDIRDQFPQDDQGRVLFFTQPPVVNDRAMYGTGDQDSVVLLRHSEIYQEVQRVKRRKVELDADVPDFASTRVGQEKMVKADANDVSMHEDSPRDHGDLSVSNDIKVDDEDDIHQSWTVAIQKAFESTDPRNKMERDGTTARKRGQSGPPNNQHGPTKNSFNKAGFLQGWDIDPWRGVYLDDRESRLP